MDKALRDEGVRFANIERKHIPDKQKSQYKSPKKECDWYIPRQKESWCSRPNKQSIK